MLSISEFRVGDVAEAPLGSLILPRSTREQPGLIGQVEDVPYFVFLNARNNFGAFEQSVRLRNPGIIIPDVSVEVDESSVGEYDAWDARAGSFVFEGGKVGVLAGDTRTEGVGRFMVTVADVTRSEVSVSFSRWQVVLGSGRDRKVLLSIDAIPSA
ncbi:hypothetical protein GFL72_38130 [Rhizobium leguminosarum bv. viciae]|uniref:hypothetical protein n=1 Tax=Rhizobium leguminosarum TaxID=384 RepID=UPI001441B394|nr:hypothetical protein [Rhizobium leguminosarum]NKK40327.1 hypothetical protein [Rhizobium leguminosarum bv. viciae]